MSHRWRIDRDHPRAFFREISADPGKTRLYFSYYFGCYWWNFFDHDFSCYVDLCDQKSEKKAGKPDGKVRGWDVRVVEWRVQFETFRRQWRRLWDRGGTGNGNRRGESQWHIKRVVPKCIFVWFLFWPEAQSWVFVRQKQAHEQN